MSLLGHNLTLTWPRPGPELDNIKRSISLAVNSTFLVTADVRHQPGGDHGLHHPPRPHRPPLQDAPGQDEPWRRYQGRCVNQRSIRGQ